METYCIIFKKNIVNKNSSVRRTRENRLMLASNCVFCVKKNPGSLKVKKLEDYWVN